MKGIHTGTARSLRVCGRLCLTACCWLIVAPSAPAADLPAPIAHWKLDDDGREARDSVGVHHGTIHGAVTHEGKLGKARLFDRSKGDHVSIPHSPDFEIGTFTVSAGVWLTKEPTFSGILGTRSGGKFNFDMKVNADKVRGDIGDGTRWIDTKINFYKDDPGSSGQGGDLETKRWSLITFVIDSDTKECRLYLDGDRKNDVSEKSGRHTPCAVCDSTQRHTTTNLRDHFATKCLHRLFQSSASPLKDFPSTTVYRRLTRE